MTFDQFNEKANTKTANQYVFIHDSYKGLAKKVRAVCKKHNKEFSVYAGSVLEFGSGCPICNDHRAGSAQQVTVNLLINKAGIATIYNDRKLLHGKEIDILIPEHNLGIEYNGLYWHSEAHKNGEVNGRSTAKWHMRDKQIAANLEGVFVAHFDSSIPHEKIVNYVKFKCGKVDRVFARKTEVIHLNKEVAQKFFDKWHIQGHAKGCQYTGLSYGGELVGAMAMSVVNSERGNTDKSRWELRRMVFSCHVIGGASKLFKNFMKRRKDISTVVSFSDNRWFDGGVYEALGFTLVKTSTPDYAYTKGNQVFHKAQFRRSVMEKKKNFDYDKDFTEAENAAANGFYRIYDCGKKKWELNLKEIQHES
jgi:hypothetical protein